MADRGPGAGARQARFAARGVRFVASQVFDNAQEASLYRRSGPRVGGSPCRKAKRLITLDDDFRRYRRFRYQAVPLVMSARGES
jgi:hypothetical protein